MITKIPKGSDGGSLNLGDLNFDYDQALTALSTVDWDANEQTKDLQAENPALPTMHQESRTKKVVPPEIQKKNQEFFTSLQTEKLLFQSPSSKATTIELELTKKDQIQPQFAKIHRLVLPDLEPKNSITLAGTLATYLPKDEKAVATPTDEPETHAPSVPEDKPDFSNLAPNWDEQPLAGEIEDKKILAKDARKEGEKLAIDIGEDTSLGNRPKTEAAVEREPAAREDEMDLSNSVFLAHLLGEESETEGPPQSSPNQVFTGPASPSRPHDEAEAAIPTVQATIDLLDEVEAMEKAANQPPVELKEDLINLSPGSTESMAQPGKAMQPEESIPKEQPLEMPEKPWEYPSSIAPESLPIYAATPISPAQSTPTYVEPLQKFQFAAPNQKKDDIPPNSSLVEEKLPPALVDILYRLKHPVSIELEPFLLTGEELVQISRGEEIEIDFPLHAEIEMGDQKIAKVGLKLTPNQKLHLHLLDRYL